MSNKTQPNNGNGNGVQYYRFLSWQNIVATATLFLMVGGAFWALAYLPINEAIKELKSDIIQIRTVDQKTLENLRESGVRHNEKDAETFLTIKEHNEFKDNVTKKIDHLTQDVTDIEKSLNTVHGNQQAVLEFKHNLENDINRIKDRILWLERFHTNAKDIPK